MLNDFFEHDKTPREIHIGLRMVKTVIAVFISGIISYLRDVPPFFAMFSAVICMQNSAEQSIISALNRILGTVIGAAFGLGLHYLAEYVGFFHLLPIYYALLALVQIPIMLLLLFIKKPSVISLSCVICISVALSTEPSALVSGIQRVIETTIGIVAALFINIVLPNHHEEMLQKECCACDDQSDEAMSVTDRSESVAEEEKEEEKSEGESEEEKSGEAAGDQNA